MCLFAIGDLHLPGGDEKPMDVFGPQWDGHFFRISEDWRQRVKPEDTVLIPGDISWAMQLQDAIPDLQAIGELPGKKILLKGNHDYWWSSVNRIRDILPEGMRVLQNDALETENAIICGSRGWNLPTQEMPLASADEKIYRRELQRMELSLNAARAMGEGKPIVVMMHFPPLYDNLRDTAFTELIERYGVQTVVYGHLHGQGLRTAFNGEHHGVEYRLVSCDGIDFKLAKILPD